MSEVHRTKINLEQWRRLSRAVKAAKKAAVAASCLADELAMDQCDSGDEAGMRLLMQIAEEIDLHSPDVHPRSEWVGGEAWKWREPHCVGGCSFPAYFDADGNPQR